MQGLEIAINDIFPHVEHRNCARNVYSNWSGRKKAKEYEFSFWEIVKASIEREWEEDRDRNGVGRGGFLLNPSPT